ncbi:MAG: hypothetical protein D6737_15895 [Chloroflexi bacterium]|nr:MAG: hypothetical protein CUN54_00630 [Phototrophicales bacterium]RMF78096.1 MAG: hypothetical protein D6737_15895 [Chloroflexota bacterium]
MSDRLLAIVIGIIFAVALGYLVARRSRDEEAIHAGTLAIILHDIAASAISGILPLVIASLVLGNGFRFTFPVAVGFMAVGWVALILHAALERNARAHLEDRGWTEEDARASGL